MNDKVYEINTITLCIPLQDISELFLTKRRAFILYKILRDYFEPLREVGK